jgi:hypothetical protein
VSAAHLAAASTAGARISAPNAFVHPPLMGAAAAMTAVTAAVAAGAGAVALAAAATVNVTAAEASGGGGLVLAVSSGFPADSLVCGPAASYADGVTCSCSVCSCSCVEGCACNGGACEGAASASAASASAPTHLSTCCASSVGWNDLLPGAHTRPLFSST